jgi:hypothetical protein
VAAALVLAVVVEVSGALAALGLVVACAVALWSMRRRLGGWRMAAGISLALVLLLEAVVVLATGSFMASRLATSERDLGGRLAHWGRGLTLLQDPADWAVGIGLGRLPAHYVARAGNPEFSGSVQWVGGEPGTRHVRLSGPATRGDLAGLHALTQRIPADAGAAAVAYRLTLDARTDRAATLLASVCELHLLYEGECRRARLSLDASSAWQPLAATFDALPPPAVAGPVMRPRVFALAVAQAGAQVQVDNLRLVGADDRDRLRNGDFAAGGAHWWPAAREYFVPWHIDSLYLEWLIERGMLGLAVLLAVSGAALWQLLRGPARTQPMAPFLAASLIGALVLGLVSSIADMPRVAALWQLLLLLSLSLDAPGQGAAPTWAVGRTS